jgi:selenocysteine lyase/cysteine desulfurase/RimJ/RimL family protein N-acetyltransferase
VSGRPDDSIRELFEPADGLTYLDAATYGLPPRSTVAAMSHALAAWQHGTARWVDDWDKPAEAARGLFAELIGASAEDIALIPTVSIGTGLVANGLEPGDVVVVPDDEHVSDLYPLLIAERRGVVVRQVPFASLPDAIDESVRLVVTSLVQMQTGRVADLARITERAKSAGTRVFVDSTHGTPFVEVAEHIGAVDYLVCHAYKHLLGARGCAFLYVRRDRIDELDPVFANWRGATAPWTTFFGGPLDLAPDASRFNVSLAWLPWVATVESLRCMTSWRRDGVLADVMALADRFARALGLEPTGSSLVCVPVADPEAVRSSLDQRRIKAAVRGDSIRFSVHVWNDDADVDRAVEAIGSVELEDGTRIETVDPEVELASKARELNQENDDAFGVAWPTLDERAREWLRATIERQDPRHPWLNRMAAPDRPVRRDGSRVRLREATLADAEVVDARAADPTRLGEFNDLGAPRPPSLVANLAHGKRMVGPDRGSLLVERIEDGAVIGDVGWHTVSYGPNEASRAFNIGISLDPEARGQGFGTQAQRLIAEVLFDLYDLDRVEASTDIDNVAEQRSLEKAGYTREGVLRRAQFRAGGRHDLVSYSILRDDL